MASYMSILDSQPEYQSPVNLALLDKVMSGKQQKFDKNLAEIDQTLAELKVQENLLIRTEDKQRFANTAQSLIDTMNRSGKMDVSSDGLKRQITGQIKTVLDDDYLVEQIGNSQKIRNFYKEVDEKRKKSDGTYSDINFNDAIKQGGVEEYLNGVDKNGNKVDTVGQLQYKNYIDAPKVINDLTGKWAKDHGYKTVFDSKNGGYYFENTKREILTKNEILNFIGSVVDPNIQSQLQINARSTFGSMNDSDYNKYFTKRYEQENLQDSEELARQKALKKSVTGQDTEIIDSNITSLEERINERKSKIQSGTFDRSEQYGAYQKDLFTSIADNYDRNTIIDIEYDTTPLEIAKFELDKAYKMEDIRIKQEKLKLDKDVASEENGSVGTALPEIPEQDEDLPDNFTQIRESFIDTQVQLKAVLERDDVEYRTLESKEAKDAYLLQIIKTGGKINPNSKEPLSISVVNAVNNHKGNYDAYVGYKKGVFNTIDTSIVDIYEDLRQGLKSGSDLKVNNLAITMPNFAKALKSGKEFSQLTAEEKELARYEFASNALKYGTGNSDKEKEMYDMYLTSVSARNKKNPQFKNKTAEANKEVGFWSGIGDVLTGGFTTSLGVASALVGGAWDSVFQGDDAGRKAFNSGVATALQGINTGASGIGQLSRTSRDIMPNRQDTNITEIEGRDTSTGFDAWQRFTTKVRGSVAEQDETIKPYIKTMPNKTSYSFSTENKSQAQTAELLRQVVVKNGGELPTDGDNNYDLSYNSKTKQYEISYITKEDKEKVKVPLKIDENLMPKVLRESVNTSQENWSTNKNNPKARLPIFVYTPPISEIESVQIIENFNKIAPGTFSEEEQYKMAYNPIFYPPQDKYDAIVEQYPVIKEDAQKQEQLKELIDSSIEVVPVVSPGNGFFADVYKVKNGRRVRLNKGNDIPLGASYEPQDFLRKQVQLIGEFTNIEVQKIIK